MKVLLYERETDVMHVLWDLGSGTVADVRARLPADLAYTTVLTLLQKLEAKGYVAHVEDGKAYRYMPLIKREQASRSAVRHLIQKVFRGSSELLLTQLVSSGDLSDEEIVRLRDMLNKQIRRRRK